MVDGVRSMAISGTDSMVYIRLSIHICSVYICILSSARAASTAEYFAFIDQQKVHTR